MIDILENLISTPMLLTGFVLDNLILFLRTPSGFIVSFLSLAYVEGLTARSIIKDLKNINMKPAIDLVKNYKLLKSIKPWTQRSLQTFYSLSLAFF